MKLDNSFGGQENSRICCYNNGRYYLLSSFTCHLFLFSSDHSPAVDEGQDWRGVSGPNRSGYRSYSTLHSCHNAGESHCHLFKYYNT